MTHEGIVPTCILGKTVDTSFVSTTSKFTLKQCYIDMLLSKYVQ